ncbi:hypothetical protein B2G71_21515 [Novosphingobium sp. PC22D]|uniref:Crp/Fnr family transcriptional regulator n=1 Tax=Novosphingobium sp. PC22D TaxID=1962403 RepID=UPI000BF0AFF9|nr:Crp/Fnr family transcriptional regulator [Novosphingobium sp. PC22D]PEQ10598.1 hypothetical protein B2G71_21515 [Novosphingobium sp. PC22D]
MKQLAEDVLGKRLARLSELTESDMLALRASSLGSIRSMDARSDLIREGDPTRAVFLIVSGWAARYKMLEDGRRQTVALLLPGDLCDLNNNFLSEMDHSIGTLTPVRYVEISHRVVERLSQEYPRIATALWIQLLATVSIQREWVVNIGQRTALERIGHLFCELCVRLQLVGLANTSGFDMPITQQDIADAAGLTSVHINRTLKEMRAQHLIVLENRSVKIPDFDALAQASLFTPAYLHLRPASQSSPAPPGLGLTAP